MTTIDDLAREMAAAGLIALAPPAEIIIEDETDIDDVLQSLADELLPGEAPLAPVDDETLESLTSDLSLEEAKSEVYAEQEIGAAFVEPTVVDAAADFSEEAALTVVKTRTPRVSGTTRSPRFAAGAGSYVASVAGDASLAAIVDGLPKKVKDKAANLIEHITKGKALSVYTAAAVEVLKTEGKLSSKRMVDAFQAQAKRNGGDGYSIGTARSQAGQMVSLFGKMGIIQADGSVNRENNLAQSLGV